MKKLLTVLFIILLSSIASTAQDTTQLPRLNFKYNFTSIADLTAPYIQLSVEYPLAKRISLENELGYMYNRFGLLSFEPYTGIRSRNQLRFYLPDNSNLINISLDLHVVGKYVAFPTREYVFSRFDGAYNQQFSTSIRYQDVGFLLGNTIILHIKEMNSSIEIGSGLGIKQSFSNQVNRNIPEDARIITTSFQDVGLGLPLDWERNILLIMLINLKIGIYF